MAVAQDGRVDLLAKWMGILVRGGHARSARPPRHPLKPPLHVLGHQQSSLCFSPTCMGRKRADIAAELIEASND